MLIDIGKGDLKNGVLALAMLIIEIIRDALRGQALRRVDSGSLSEAEVERLGRALMELDAAIERIKEEQGVTESVQLVREELDDLVNDLVHDLEGIHPGIV